jgi:hypothetical protein
VRAVGPALRVGGGKEEEALPPDKSAILVGEARAQDLLRQDVGDTPAVEAVLQGAALLVVHGPVHVSLR